MAEPAPATPPAPRALEPFEGRDVIGAKVAITKAGDGLSQGLAVDPQAFDLGAKVFVVLACDVAKIRYSEVKDTGALVREHTFEAGTAVIVDESLVGELIAHQRELIEIAKEKAAGIERLDFVEEETEHPAVVKLSALKAPQLKELCLANAVEFPRTATKARLVELLVEQVPGIEAVADSFATVPDDGESTVTSIEDAVPDGPPDTWEYPHEEA